MGKGTPLLKAFSAANDILSGAVQGIAELITRPGLINVDFADVRTVMSEMGTAMMGHGSASGEDRAEEASESAIACPLLEDIDLSGARGILVNITAGPDFSIDEFETVGNAVKAFASENATVVVGTVIDMEMTDELRVTVVATGIGAEKKPDISLVSNRTSKVIPDSNEFKLQANGGAHAMPSANQMPEPSKAIERDEKPEQGNDLEYLDIPAFLRKQAD
jgi:cell division protein FtsZ